MIVRTANTTYLLITQPSHARLARQVMESCVALQTHPRRDSILLAIGEHDNGWAEEDAAMTVDPETGALHDFIHAPLEVRHRVWPRGIARLRHDRWAAALVAQHALVAYDRFRQEPAWASFFAEITRERDVLRNSVGAAEDTLLDDYRYVRVGDLLSLTFCLGWTGSQAFTDVTVASEDGTRVSITPTFFGGATIPMSITARSIPKRRYVSDADLHDAIRASDTTTLEGAAV